MEFDRWAPSVVKIAYKVSDGVPFNVLYMRINVSLIAGISPCEEGLVCPDQTRKIQCIAHHIWICHEG